MQGAVSIDAALFVFGAARFSPFYIIYAPTWGEKIRAAAWCAFLKTVFYQQINPLVSNFYRTCPEFQEKQPSRSNFFG